MKVTLTRVVDMLPEFSIVTDPLQQRFSNCGPRTTSGPRVLPLWSFSIEH